ncbi:MAG: FtsQ-type POTRA domain-containing protein [Nitriliruptorales bacterium]|nr:FtsQ-type POTRA domain-containing protein [Nitriliruptorales bacterium]
MTPARSPTAAPRPAQGPREPKRRWRFLRLPFSRRPSPAAGGTAAAQEQASRSGRNGLGMHERFRARRQEVEDAGRRRRRRITGSLVALVTLAGMSVSLSFSPLFAVAGVQVTGLDPVREREAWQAAGISPGQNLLFVDLAGAEDAVRALPYVAAVEIRRVSASILEVAVAAREPVAVLRLEAESWLVDAGGTLVGGGTLPDAVPIDAPGTPLPPVGEQIGPSGVRTALAIHAGLPPELRNRVERYDARDEHSVRLLLRPGTPAGDGSRPISVRVGDAGRVQAKGQAIALLLERLAAQPDLDLERYELDVRAPDNPVLRPLS